MSQNETGSLKRSGGELGEWLTFKSHIVDLWTVLRRHGIDQPAITDKNYPRFKEMTLNHRNGIINFVQKQIEIYNAAEGAGVEFADTKSLLQTALRVLRLGIDARFMELIDRTDVIELYSMEHIQLFRSFNFFELCNYNLDDVLMYEWFTLYERDQSITDLLLADAVLQLKKLDGISRFGKDVGKHVMREKFSENQGVFNIEFKHIAPAYSGPGQKAAYVLSQTCEILGEVKKERVHLVNLPLN